MLNFDNLDVHDVEPEDAIFEEPKKKRGHTRTVSCHDPRMFGELKAKMEGLE